MTSFESYRDDDDEDDQHREGYDDDDECDNEHQGLLKGHHRTQLLPKMDYTPFKLRTPLFSNNNDTHSSLQEVRAPSSMSLSSQPRSKPRNPQGKRTWKDNDDGMADAEEILDVNDLIAEQVSFGDRCKGKVGEGCPPRPHSSGSILGTFSETV